MIITRKTLHDGTNHIGQVPENRLLFANFSPVLKTLEPILIQQNPSFAKQPDIINMFHLGTVEIKQIWEKANQQLKSPFLDQEINTVVYEIITLFSIGQPWYKTYLKELS